MSWRDDPVVTSSEDETPAWMRDPVVEPAAESLPEEERPEPKSALRTITDAMTYGSASTAEYRAIPGAGRARARNLASEISSEIGGGTPLPVVPVDHAAIRLSLGKEIREPLRSADVLQKLIATGVIDPRYEEIRDRLIIEENVSPRDANEQVLALATGANPRRLDALGSGATSGAFTGVGALVTAWGGAKAGAAATAGIPPVTLPTAAIRVGAPVLGFVGGLLTGGFGAGAFADMVSGQTDRTPEARRAELIAQTVSANLFGGAVVYKALPTVSNTPFLESAFGRFLVRMGQYAKRNPKTYAAAITAETAVASMGTAYSQTFYPEREGMRFLFEVGGGFAGAALRGALVKVYDAVRAGATQISSGATERRAVENILQNYADQARRVENVEKMTPEQKTSFFSQILKEIDETAPGSAFSETIRREAGDNVDFGINLALQRRLILGLQEEGININDVRTVAQKIPELTILERSLRESPAFNREVLQRAEKSNRTLREAIATFIVHGQDRGSENSLAAAAAAMYENNSLKITQLISEAEEKLATIFRAVTFDASSTTTEKTKIIADKVGAVAERALFDARAQERALWSKVDKSISYDVSDLFDWYDNLSAFQQKRLIPYIRSALSARKLNKNGEEILGSGGTLREKEGVISAQDVMDFRSDLISEMRAAKANPSLNRYTNGIIKTQTILENLVDTQSTDLNNIALQSARSYSRALNDVFLRAFAGSVLGETPSAARRLSPESVVSRLKPGAAGQRRAEELNTSIFFLRRSAVSEILGDMSDQALSGVPLTSAQRAALDTFRATKATGTTPEIRDARLALENTFTEDNLRSVQRAIGIEESPDVAARIQENGEDILDALRLVFADDFARRRIRQADGTIDPKKLNSFINENRNNFSFLPEDLREAVSDPAITGILADLIKRADSRPAQRLRDMNGFFQLLIEDASSGVVARYPDNVGRSIREAVAGAPGVSGEDAIRAMARIAKDGNAEEGMKAAVIKYLFDESVGDVGSISMMRFFDKWKNPIQGEVPGTSLPSLETLLGPGETGIFTAQEIANINRIVNQGVRLEVSLLTPGRLEEIISDPTSEAAQLFQRTAGSILGTELAKIISGRGTLIAAGAGSKAVQNVMRKNPILLARKKLEEFMLNPELAARALEDIPVNQLNDPRFLPEIQRSLADITSEALFGRRGVVSVSIWAASDPLELRPVVEPEPAVETAPSPPPPPPPDPPPQAMLQAEPTTQMEMPVPLPESSLSFERFMPQMAEAAPGGAPAPATTGGLPAAPVLFPNDPLLQAGIGGLPQQQV